MLSLLGGVFLGWSLGANDAANVFGTAVSTKMLRFWTAALLAAVFVVAGAVEEGRYGIETLKNLTQFDLEQAVISSVAAALTVTLMTFLGLPVSTSQAMVGAILGIGLINQQLNISGFGKIVLCWIGTPFGAALFSVLSYRLLGAIYNRLPINLFQSDSILRFGFVLAGTYGAFTLGANNVANVTAVFVGAGFLNVHAAALIGGLSIAAGILTFSRPVMRTVGKGLVRMDPFSALIVVFSLALTLHVYTFAGVPVSSSQAVIGAVLGIGILRGVNTVSKRKVLHILFAWFLSPLIACVTAFVLFISLHLEYIP